MKKTLIITILFLKIWPSYCQVWENTGGGFDNTVYSLIEYKNFYYAGGRYIFKNWDGGKWNNLTRPFGLDYILTFAIFNDTLYCGGNNQNSLYSTVYKLSGTNWIEVGKFGGQSHRQTNKLFVFKEQIISGGYFTNDDLNLVSWDGKTWNKLGNGLNGPIYYLAEYQGYLFASGHFSASGGDTTIQEIAKWDGKDWLPFASTHKFNKGHDKPIVSFNNLLLIGNVWDTIQGTPMLGIAVWDGKTFTSRGNNLLHDVNSFWIFNNELYLCGNIYTLQPHSYSNVVLKWNGFFWEQVGLDFNETIWVIGDFNKQLYCGGQFKSPHPYIAKLNPIAKTSEVKKQANFKFYPNPSVNQITFNSTDIGMLSISNQLGQIIYSTFISNNLTPIATDNFPKGIYVITFETRMMKTSSKLIIQ